MEQKYILYIILAFFIGILVKSLSNTKICNNENFFVEPSSWSCSNNIMTPVRMNDKGDVECMATNGKDCLWTADLNTCNNTIGQNNDSTKLNPLACGDMHKSIYGSPGYDNPAHWCAITKAAFPPPAAESPPPATSDETEFDSEDSTSPIDTTPPSVGDAPIDFSRYTKIMGKSKNGKTIMKYNNNQPKCVKDCALNKQCIGVITNKSGTRCKTITDFTNPHKSLNIAYLKK